MSINTSKEIEWLKAKILPKLLKEQKIIDNFQDNDMENFQILNCEIKVVGKQEAFMLTTCYKVAIEYKFQNVNNTIHLFVKKTPKLSQEIYESINFKALFSNEIFAYEKLMPALQKFCRINLKMTKFYYAELEKNCATIITEDFTCRQWKVCKDLVNISLEHILLGVEYLAEFHAIGFAWRHLNPQQFNELTKELKEARFTSYLHPSRAIILRESKKRALAATRKYEPNVDNIFLENLENLLGDTYHYSKERVKPQEPMITLCHGDYLRNNVAFKYDKYDLPLDIMMFDLQTLRVSSPMVDLTLFLSLSTYAEVRYTHFAEIFTLYSDTLRDTYKKMVPGPTPKYLCQEVLLKEYIRYLPYSIGICAAFLMTLVDPKTETSQEMLAAQPTEEEMIQDVMNRGGDAVDQELSHQVKELYELHAINDINIFEEFPLK